MNGSLLSKMITQDITGAIKAFQADDFDLLNIFGNRIMSDALFGDDSKSALPGFFVKHVALIFLGMKPRLAPAKFSAAKRIGKGYLDTLSTFAENTEDAALWQDFHKFNSDVREYLVIGIDNEVYEEDPEITRAVPMWLIRYLSDEKEVLLTPYNLFLKGVLNEAERISRVFGCQLADTYAISLLVALDRYYDYVWVRCRTPVGDLNTEKAREMVFPYVEEITQLVCSEAEIKPHEVTIVLWKMIKGWRQSFIHYMELLARTPEKVIELPEESKKKLAQVVGKALEREAKREVKPK
jgi:hypothetical protein